MGAAQASAPDHLDAQRDMADQLAHGHSLVPDHLWTGITGHILYGVPTGNFLTGLFENDLLKATGGADEVSLARIRDLALFMHNYAPSRCWGSQAKVKRWRDAGGIRGGAHLLEERADD